MKNLACYLFLLFLAPGPLLFSQKKLSKEQIQQIDALFEAWNNENNPGGAIGIVKNGEMIFSKGYGMANLQHKIPFSPASVADIGSVAKQITSFSIALLADEGKLSLDDEIHDFFPDLPRYPHPITVRHLVHHTSGLREIYGALQLTGWTGGDGIRQEDVLELLRLQKELNFKPGERYSYCNTAYGLLGEIIQKASGQSFEDFLQARIFKPLGMNHTYVMDRQGEIFPNEADSYQPTSEGFLEVYDNSTMVGQGGIYSNVEDMAKWVANFQQPRVGNKAVMRQILEKAVLNNGDTLNYAFGLNNLVYRGTQLVTHSGSSAGFRSWMAWFPNHDLGIVIQTNRSDAERAELMPKVTEILMKDQLAEEEKEEDSKDNNPVKPEKKEYSLEKLTKYAGQYYSPELEKVYHFYVDEAEKKLMVRSFRTSPFQLKPQPERHAFSGPNFKMEFQEDDAGRITGFRISNGRVLGLKFFKTSLPSF